MTAKEQAFMRDLKEILDKHQVAFAKDAVYYPGDSENARFVLPQEPGATIITIDDMADLRGGWGKSPL